MQPKEFKILLLSWVVFISANSYAAGAAPAGINQPIETPSAHPLIPPTASAPAMVNAAVASTQAPQPLMAPMPKPNAASYPSMAEVSKWYSLANTIESKKNGPRAKQKASWTEKAFYEYLGSVEGINKGQIKYLGQSVIVSEGDTLMGYKITKIEQFAVSMKKGKESLTLTPEHDDSAPLQQGMQGGIPPSPAFGGSPMAQMLH